MKKPDHAPGLKQIQGFLLDMDGTLYLGDQPLPGSRQFIAHLDTEGIPYFCLTNNSSKSAIDYFEKLTRLGYSIGQDRILTSGQVTATALATRFPGSAIYVVGTTSLEQEFLSVGFLPDPDEPELVVVGFDTGITYAKLNRLCALVRAGVPYFATHPDLNCPTEAGPIPDIGATLAFVEAATGRQPDEIFGKPYPALIETIRIKTGLRAETLCMVGDRLYTDIAMGRHGLKTCLVLSGETQLSDLDGSPDQPDWIFQNTGELLAAIRAR